MNPKPASRKKSKLEAYIDTRLWNSRINGSWEVRTKQILKEIEMRYLHGRRIVEKPDLLKDLTKYIDVKRKQLNKHWNYIEKQATGWSKMLDTDEEHILDLVRSKLITKQKDVRILRKIMQVTGHIEDDSFEKRQKRNPNIVA